MDLVICLKKDVLKFEFHKQLKLAFIISILVSALYVINIFQYTNCGLEFE